MDIRGKIRQNVEPALEPGETLVSAFPAQSGISPWLMIGTGLLLIWRAKFSIVAVTDRRIVVFKRSAFGVVAKPGEVLGTFPRDTRLGKQSGIFGTIELGGTKYYVHKKFRKDVEAADNTPAAATAPAAT